MSTSRFGLGTYEEGDDEWSHTDTVELLDELAVETDVIANRPTDGSYTDEMFYATDQRILYRYDGTDWQPEAGLGQENNVLDATLFIDQTNAVVSKHSFVINNNYEIPSEKAFVVGGPLEGEGSITGEGRLKVV